MRIPNNLIAVSVAIGVVACSNIFGSEEPPVPYNLEDPLKAGEISLPVKPDPTFSWAPEAGVLNLGGLKSKAGGEPVLVVLGQGVAAGYRDGGLFREGQITSYPNLVAHQMGLTNFKQPLFERENGNGTGRLTIDKTSEHLRWNEVTNNIAYIAKGNSPELYTYTDGKINNFSVPGFHPSFYGHNPGELLADDITYFDKNPSSVEKFNVNYLWDKYALSTALASRFIPRGTGTGWDKINDLKPDIGIIDVGMDIYVLNGIRGTGPGLSTSQRWPDWEIRLLDNVKKTGMRYVYTTVPDVFDFPYFKLYTYESMVKKTGSIPTGSENGYIGPTSIEPGDILVPTANIVNLYNGRFQGSLTDADVIRKKEIGRPEFYNNWFVKKAAKDYSHPLVDFYSIYKKVLAGQYVSEDGFRIDPSFPNGNFFSSDGIYPSAIGQAVLANEVIKVFNASYGMKIPLINISVYSVELSRN